MTGSDVAVSDFLSHYTDLSLSDFFAHYASEYYDPVKAREYYLRNRELKGRQSTSGMSETQREAWTYTKDAVNAKKKTALEEAAAQQKAYLDSVREQVQARREEIREQLVQLIQALSDKRSDDAKQIDKLEQDALEQLTAEFREKAKDIRAAAEDKIAALPPIPEGVSPARLERLTDDRAKQIAKIRGTASSDIAGMSDSIRSERDAIAAEANGMRQDLADKTASDKDSERNNAKASQEELRTALTNTVNQARADYTALKEQITAEYEAKAQQEFDGIKANLPGAPASGAKKGSKKDDKAAKPRKPGVKVMSLEEAAVASIRRK